MFVAPCELRTVGMEDQLRKTTVVWCIGVTQLQCCMPALLLVMMLLGS